MLFTIPPRPVKANEVRTAGNIGSIFGPLALPVVIALLCLRPRVWADMSFIWDDVINIDLHKAIVGTIVIATVPPHCALWLLATFTRYVAQQYKRKRSGSMVSESGIETVAEEKDWFSILRPRAKRLRYE